MDPLTALVAAAMVAVAVIGLILAERGPAPAAEPEAAEPRRVVRIAERRIPRRDLANMASLNRDIRLWADRVAPVNVEVSIETHWDSRETFVVSMYADLDAVAAARSEAAA